VCVCAELIEWLQAGDFDLGLHIMRYQHATSKVTIDTTPPMLATATRQRSFSVAGTLPSSYAQSAMSPYYVSGHPASYQD
jgi:hypothetical protein